MHGMLVGIEEEEVRAAARRASDEVLKDTAGSKAALVEQHLGGVMRSIRRTFLVVSIAVTSRTMTQDTPSKEEPGRRSYAGCSTTTR
jgi:hypothetical protein